MSFALTRPRQPDVGQERGACLRRPLLRGEPVRARGRERRVGALRLAVDVHQVLARRGERDEEERDGEGQQSSFHRSAFVVRLSTAGATGRRRRDHAADAAGQVPHRPESRAGEIPRREPAAHAVVAHDDHVALARQLPEAGGQLVHRQVHARRTARSARVPRARARRRRAARRGPGPPASGRARRARARGSKRETRRRRRVDERLDDGLEQRRHDARARRGPAVRGARSSRARRRRSRTRGRRASAACRTPRAAPASSR